MFHSFKVFGIAPISYDYVWDNAKNSHNLIFKTSWIARVYNVALIFYFIPTGFIAVMNYKNNFVDHNPQQKLIYTVLLFLFGTSNIFILIAFVFQHNEMKSIANKIIKLQELTTKSHLPNKKLYTFFIVNYFISYLINIFILFYRFKTQVVFVTFFYISIYRVLFLLAQYSLLLKMIKDFFKSINDDLNDILLKQPICVLDTFNLNVKIDKLMHSHKCLCDVSRDISSFYSFSMMCATLNILMLSLMFSYFLIKRLVLNDHPERILGNVIVIYLSTITLTLLVVYVSNTIKEVLYIIIFYFLH